VRKANVGHEGVFLRQRLAQPGTEPRRPRFPAEEEPLLRLLLIVIVIAIGADAIINNGAYTQAAWRELTSYTVRFQNPSGSDPKLEIEKKP
jgi:hypothetical protein